MKMGAMLVAAEAMDVGCNTLSKAAMSRGMNNFVFVVYSHAFGAFFLLLPTFLFHRKVAAPSINCSIVFRLFLLGFVNYCCVLFLFSGIRQSSPTLASALNNLSPAFTVIFAVFFRMEDIDLRVRSSIYKSIGTIISISGAFIVIFYKGLAVTFVPSSDPSPLLLVSSRGANWVLGGFLLAASSVLNSLALIVKASVMRDYPSELLVALISCSFETIIATLVGLVVVKDTNMWKLKPNLELMSILFAAILIVGALSLIHCWVVRTKGPVFVAMFKPLQMIIAFLLGVTLLSDTLHLGSLIGGATIAAGFYMVMNGKAMEESSKKVKNVDDLFDCETSDERAPLLHGKEVYVQNCH